ncbi:hypothetical protein AVEN_5679-1 [Araneus ventricosus]|uniref:Uncharacterized protein n=1 Tax=Araneus ventricosus TaxID=182803 RepID=A0A4Y2DTT1_ARAVE|nr:hypothetical protein AVEN_5679-1 [Araneus ventricosus]
MTKTAPELASPSPPRIWHYTSGSIFNRCLNVRQTLKHWGSSVESRIEPGSLRSQDLTTRSSQPLPGKTLGCIESVVRTVFSSP